MTHIFVKLRSMVRPTIYLTLPLVFAGIAVYGVAPKFGLHLALTGAFAIIALFLVVARWWHRSARGRATLGWLFSDMHGSATQVCVETVPVLVASIAAGFLYWKGQVAVGDLATALGFYLLYFAAWYPIFGAEARRDTEAHLVGQGLAQEAVEAAGILAERRASRASWVALVLGTMAGVFGSLDTSLTLSEFQSELNGKASAQLTICPGKGPGAIRANDPSLCTKLIALNQEVELQTRKITALCGVISHMSADFKDDAYLAEASTACNIKPPPELPYPGAPTWPIERAEPTPATSDPKGQ